MSDPFAVLASVVLTDTETAPLFGPLPGYERLMFVRHYAINNELNDVQTLELAEALGLRVKDDE